MRKKTEVLISSMRGMYYFHGETNWVTWGAVRASSQRVFGTPLERRRRADLALLTRERLQTKIVNMIGTGNRKKLAVLTACFAPCGLVRC